MSVGPDKTGVGGSIGKYEIVEPIGSGGFATVFKAWDPVIKRAVAIKMCKVGSDLHARFFQEAELAGRLQHPNITTIYECGVEGEVPFLVQELLSGEDLSALIARREAIPLAEKIRILVGVALGLEYAHHAGVIHRDIKPANIRLLESGAVKIMDFGIAKAIGAPSGLTGPGVTVGSSSYMSPEQVSGDPVDFRTDIFSFGVVAYELFTFRQPFHDDNLFRLLETIVKEDAESLARVAPDLPLELVTLVERAMQKDPADRFASMKQMRDLLAAAHRDSLQAPSSPATEDRPHAERIQAEASNATADTGTENEFQDIARLASQLCDTPVALISFADRERQWFKAAVGIPLKEAPRQLSFCAQAILGSDVMVVPDAAADGRFATQPMVTQEPFVRFYAGAPLFSSDGLAVGTLSVLDRRPRSLSTAQQDGLRVLARQIMAQLELKRRRREDAKSSGEKLLLQVAGLSDYPIAGNAPARKPARAPGDADE